jgi:glycosyltransferase involved in cell wall biosynthesis
MIGDGPMLEETRRNLAEGRATAGTIFAGRTLQADGAAHLAACDILVSPHVPNPDGTPFFGSPTKLFEYMAMGKPIVASDLDQIGEVLEHDRTAWLVAPGDPDALAIGIETLVDDRERGARLGAAARDRAVDEHTWRAHVERILEALRARCP